MPISSNRYVNITSGVGGAAATSARELMLRLVTTNELVPTGGVLGFDVSDTTSISDYFGGSDAEEYRQALFYSSFISKTTQSPKNIQFTRWADTATDAMVFGAEAATLDTLTGYTDEDLGVILDGSTYTATGVDLSGAADYAAAATILQTEIRLLDASLDAVTVTYNSGRKGFDLDTNKTENGAISFSVGALPTSLGWDATAIYSDGVAAQTAVEVMSSSSAINNNFGSFAFIDDLTFDQIDAVAAWNHSENVLYQFYQKATKAQSITWFDDLKGYSGLGLVGYDPTITDQYPWLLPASLLASINWTRPAASTNFMFNNEATLTPLIESTADAATYDAVRLNYIGVTQNAGNNIQFFQRGYLMGGTNAPLQMGVYAGEQWFKAEAVAQFINMFIAIPNITPDDAGRAIVLSYLDSAITKAKYNNVFSIGKELTNTQIQSITAQTGLESAWRDVQSKGFWRKVEFTSTVASSGVTEYVANYTVIYSKADSVNKVEGTHTLI